MSSELLKQTSSRILRNRAKIPVAAILGISILLNCICFRELQEIKNIRYIHTQPFRHNNNR